MVVDESLFGRKTKTKGRGALPARAAVISASELRRIQGSTRIITAAEIQKDKDELEAIHAVKHKAARARKDRKVMSARQVSEYKKAAVAVVQKPWCLLRAGAYLEKWVADNQAGTYGAPSDHPIAYGHGLLRTCVWGGHGCRVAGLRAGSPSAH